MSLIKKALLKPLLLKSTVLLAGLVSMNAATACTNLGGSTLPVIDRFFFPNRLVVSDSIPVGSVIHTQEYAIGPGTVRAFARCAPPAFISTLLSPNRGAGNSSNVIPTNVQGIGYRMTMILDGTTVRAVPWSYPVPTTSTTYSWSPQSKVKLELIKIARVVRAGRLEQINFRVTAYPNANIVNGFSILELVAVSNTGAGGAIIPQPCTVTNQSINVPMGNVLRTRFSGVGSTAGDRAFNVSMNCSYQAGVSIRLDGAADASKARGVIALDAPSNGSAASGVGIQILQNNAAVNLGQYKSVGSAPGTGSYDIPFVARYYQTGASVTSGEANGSATFTLTYN
ncbi:fimbrial protein [Pantoea agglomerans]